MTLKDRARQANQPPATPGQGIAVQAPSRIDVINEQLTSRRGIIAESLSRLLDMDVFMGRVLAEFRKTPDLAACSLPSVMGAVVNMAQLGLEPGPLGHVYLTPRKNKGVQEAVLVVGYRGFIALARRSGGMSIDADAYCENDDFSHIRGTEELLTFRKASSGPRGDELGYWMAAQFDGGRATHSMTMWELNEHATKHVGKWPSGDYKGFAGANFQAWCLKTVIRQAAWRLPQSNELARAVAADETPTYYQDGQGLITVTQDGEVRDVDPVAAPASAQGGDYDPTAEPGWTGADQ